jgi:septum site-determining protein MinC
MVLDLYAVSDRKRLDIVDMIGRLRELGFVPVGIQNGSEQQNDSALAAGLCPFPAWRSGRQRPARDTQEETPDHGMAQAGAKQSEPRADEVPIEEETAAEPDSRPAMLVTQPIRSGRRVYAHGTDLVVAAPVSSGAELIADGHIHVYGALRGRALAGVHGDESARIFCQSLEAELVSIAGAYRVRDDIDEQLIGQGVQIYISEGRLIIEPLVRALR